MSEDRVGRRVLEAQAGYPKGKFQGSFDPAMGRGYRAGDQVVVPAGESKTLVNHGLIDGFFRWKISLYAEEADGAVYDATTAYVLSVDVVGKNENDAIPRNTLVGLGRGQVLYVPGRSLSVLVTNPTDQDIKVHFSLDEATPGLSAWTTDEQITTDLETPLDVAAFANGVQLYGLNGGSQWMLRGYDTSGALAYNEILSVPRSSAVAIVPSFFYTIAPVSVGTHTCTVVYSCVG